MNTVPQTKKTHSMFQPDIHTIAAPMLFLQMLYLNGTTIFYSFTEGAHIHSHT